MSSFNTSGKIGYIFNTANDTWYALTGVANPAATYIWTGSNTYTNAVVFESSVKSSQGINVFGSPTSGVTPRRDTALTSPAGGSLAFIKQKDDGTVINVQQYYNNSSWIDVGNRTTVAKIASHTLEITDANKVLTVDASEANTVTIPTNLSVPFTIGQSITIVQTGAGQTSVEGAVGVTVNSRSSMKKISARYGEARLLKVATNTWILTGDLSA